MAEDMGEMTPMHVACSQGRQEVRLRYFYIISTFKKRAEKMKYFMSHIYIFPVQLVPSKYFHIFKYQKSLRAPMSPKSMIL